MRSSDAEAERVQVSEICTGCTVDIYIIIGLFFATRRDGERLVIELGRTLRKGEYKYKVFHMKLADVSLPGFEQLPQVCEFIVCSGADVGQIKRAIIAHLATIDAKYDIAFDACRLRLKRYRTPSDIFTDDQRFGEGIEMTENLEVSS